jgi:hypothetical protein
MPAGASSSRFCAPKRKMLGAPGLRSTPDTAPTAARPVGTQHRRTVSPKRDSNASDAPIAPRLTNMPHAMSYGLDWPFTRKPREKKPTAFPPSEKSRRSRLDLARGLNQRRVHAVIRIVAEECGVASTVSPCYRGKSSTVRKTVQRTWPPLVVAPSTTLRTRHRRNAKRKSAESPAAKQGLIGCLSPGSTPPPVLRGSIFRCRQGSKLKNTWPQRLPWFVTLCRVAGQVRCHGTDVGRGVAPATTTKRDRCIDQLDDHQPGRPEPAHGKLRFR